MEAAMSSEVATTTPEIQAMEQKTENIPKAEVVVCDGKQVAPPDVACAEVSQVTSRKVEVKETELSRESTPTSEGSLEVEEPIRPKDAKARKREHKDIEHILKALNSLSTSEEKLAALCKKYTELLEEHRVLENKFKQSQRKLTVIMREKDQLQTEHSKAVLAKSKLESLCRELQRHNKVIKEESVGRAKEEEEKRKEVTAKFQDTINDIQQQMNDHYAKNTTLREENIELANKLKNLIEQYELREKHIEKVFKHKDLESQLMDAKLAQANLQYSEESALIQKERLLLVEENKECHKKIGMMEDQEKQLRAQVGLYTEKYEEFQSTLKKSNEVFGSFKSEMDKMTKKIKKLEKETSHWRTRWENSNTALVNMAEEKTRSDREIATLNSKIQKLERLCRALQDERRKNKTQPDPDAEDEESETKEEEADSEEKPSVVEVVEPTKTPPNSPESRASPETVQSQSNGTATASQLEPSAGSGDTAGGDQSEVNAEKLPDTSTEETANEVVECAEKTEILESESSAEAQEHKEGEPPSEQPVPTTEDGVSVEVKDTADDPTQNGSQ